MAAPASRTRQVDTGEGASAQAMTANQRRPGFRLPWSAEDEESSTVAASGEPASSEPPTTTAAAQESPASEDTTRPSESPASPAPAAPGKPSTTKEASPEPPAATAQATDAEASPDFMRDLVSAMRRVADEARQAGLTDIHSSTDEQVKRLEADAERRRTELRARADADVAGIGEWAKAEAERIRKEADQRVVARREQLEQQLSGETSRAEAETKALRDRIGEYERELEAYHAQLAEISDPAAFAAAAKRMPRPPSAKPPSAATATPSTGAAPAAAGVATATTATAPATDQPAATNGVAPAAAEVHPAEEEVLATRLAELDADLKDTPTEAPAAEPTGEPTTTEIVVSGLGSFGAITGFRQSLSGVDGIESVALSLGQTGEFVFRATHTPGFDLKAAITALEGDGAKIEARPEGGWRVTLERAR
jgi:hypothetical protein